MDERRTCPPHLRETPVIMPPSRHVRFAALLAVAALLTACGDGSDSDRDATETTPAPTEAATLDQEAVAAELEPSFKALVADCVASGDFNTVIDRVACADLWSEAERDRINPDGQTFTPSDIVYAERSVRPCVSG